MSAPFSIKGEKIAGCGKNSIRFINLSCASETVNSDSIPDWFKLKTLKIDIFSFHD